MKAKSKTLAAMEGSSTMLSSSGWRWRNGAWWHPTLGWPWPLADALRLQCEADDGMVDPVCMSLRGEAWPP